MTDRLGTPGNDIIYALSGERIFGLQGADTLQSTAALGDGIGLIGGSGSDTYIVSPTSHVMLVENGNSPSDKLTISPLPSSYVDSYAPINYTIFGLVDFRHLVIIPSYSYRGAMNGDLESGTVVVVLDWERPENRIETWNLEGKLTLQFAQFQNYVYSSNLFIGNIPMEQFGSAEQLAAINAAPESLYEQAIFYEEQNGPINRFGDLWGDSIDGGMLNDTIDGAGGNDTIRGLDGNDQIYGSSGSDDLNGNKGDDRVFGGGDPDFVRGGQGNDTIYGEDGDDWHVNGNIGTDIVYGGSGNDSVFGGPGQDTLSGDAGGDYLSGDLGNDLLFGGLGPDIFAVASNGGWDIVADFSRAQGDKILIEFDVNGSGLVSPEQVLTRLTSDGGDGTVIDLGGGHTLGILGMRPSDLHPDDFMVV